MLPPVPQWWTWRFCLLRYYKGTIRNPPQKEIEFVVNSVKLGIIHSVLVVKIKNDGKYQLSHFYNEAMLIATTKVNYESFALICDLISGA